MSTLASIVTNNSEIVGFGGGSMNNTKCNEDLDLAFWILDGVVGVVILAGNSLTCAVFLSTSSLRQNTMNVFLLSLAVSDLLMALFVVPWFAAFCETPCQYSLQKWCWLFGMIRDIPFEGVILNLVAITYDRYLAVFRPLVYAAKMTRRRVIIILVVAWSLPFLTGLVRLTWKFSSMPENERQEIDRGFNIFLIFFFVITPAIGIFIVNLMIMNTIKKHRSRINPVVTTGDRSHSETSDTERQERVRRRKGTMSCVLVVLVFLACWLPRMTYNFFYLARRGDLASPAFIKFTMFFVVLQSSFNPFIYSFYRQEFRQALLRLLRLN